MSPHDNLTQLEDATLLERARGGDRAAVDALLGRYRPQVEGYLKCRTRHAEDATELSQEVLIGAVTGLRMETLIERPTTQVHVSIVLCGLSRRGVAALAAGQQECAAEGQADQQSGVARLRYGRGDEIAGRLQVEVVGAGTLQQWERSDGD